MKVHGRWRRDVRFFHGALQLLHNRPSATNSDDVGLHHHCWWLRGGYVTTEGLRERTEHLDATVRELSCKITKKATQLYVDFMVWQPRLDNIT